MILKLAAKDAILKIRLRPALLDKYKTLIRQKSKEDKDKLIRVYHHFKKRKYKMTKPPKSASPFKKLIFYKVSLTPEERAIVKAKKAEWSGGTSAIWKSVSPTGKITYVTHTHRAYNTRPTLKGAIARFHKFIKGTA